MGQQAAVMYSTGESKFWEDFFENNKPPITAEEAWGYLDGEILT